MSRAKTTKRAKRYSAQHLYRHFTDLSRHIKKLQSKEGKDEPKN